MQFRSATLRATSALQLVVNAPHFFARKDFMEWLNIGTAMTWHNRKNLEAGEYSDVVVFVDPSLTGEGTDSDMPADIWKELVELCEVAYRKSDLIDKTGFHIAVRLTNENTRFTALDKLYRDWKALKDIPVVEIDSETCLDAPFLHFEKGTPVETVWHWFEDQDDDFVVAEVQQGIYR